MNCHQYFNYKGLLEKNVRLMIVSMRMLAGKQENTLNQLEPLAQEDAGRTKPRDVILSVPANNLLGLLDQAKVNLVTKGITETDKKYYALLSADVNRIVGDQSEPRTSR